MFCFDFCLIFLFLFWVPFQNLNLLTRVRGGGVIADGLTRWRTRELSDARGIDDCLSQLAAWSSPFLTSTDVGYRTIAPDQVAREVPKASGVSIGIPSRPDSPVNETDTGYASTSRGRRTTSDVRYTKDGKLAAIHMLLPLSDLDMYCPYQDLAHTILEDRQRRVNLITGDPSRVHVNHDNVYEVVDLSTYLLDIESSAVSRQSMVVAIAGGHTVPIHLDTTLAHTWHEPANESTIVRRKDHYGGPRRN
jgi:hypothetical protein